MKLIRWVEVHIGRSRKKAKKTPTKSQGSPCDVFSETASNHSATSSPLLVGGPELRDDRWKHCGRSPVPSPGLSVECRPSPQPKGCSKSAAHIRTSFLDQAPVSPADVSSPRQRSRIKTNPWIPSPRSPCGSSSADSGWAGSRSSAGSEGSEPGDLTLLHDTPWYSHWASLSSLRNPPGDLAAGGPWLATSALRTRTSSTLESHRRPQTRVAVVTGEGPLLCSTAGDGFLRCCSGHRQHPESARLYRKELPRKSLTTHISDGSSNSSSDDDEAYSEDFVQSEDSDVVTVVKALTSPQTDSACDPGSCTTTPLSECCTQLHQGAETLADKVRRLRAQRMLVQQKMQEARLEEQLSREERISLHQELMQFRRLMLLKTLQGLRSDLEHRTASAGPTVEVRETETAREH